MNMLTINQCKEKLLSNILCLLLLLLKFQNKTKSGSTYCNESTQLSLRAHSQRVLLGFKFLGKILI